MISGWRPALGTTAEIGNDDHAGDAVYKGLAIGTADVGKGMATYLYATDFHNGRIDVFDSAFASQTWAGAFTDPKLPKGYAPFGIQNLKGLLFVTYAKTQPGSDDEMAGRGLGVVDVFLTDGTFFGRVAGGGGLNAPWGLAWAPDDFGRFSGDILVGNFGDGELHAYHWNGNRWQRGRRAARDRPASRSGRRPLGDRVRWRDRQQRPQKRSSSPPVPTTKRAVPSARSRNAMTPIPTERGRPMPAPLRVWAPGPIRSRKKRWRDPRLLLSPGASGRAVALAPPPPPSARGCAPCVYSVGGRAGTRAAALFVLSVLGLAGLRRRRDAVGLFVCGKPASDAGAGGGGGAAGASRAGGRGPDHPTRPSRAAWSAPVCTPRRGSGSPASPPISAWAVRR